MAELCKPVRVRAEEACQVGSPVVVVYMSLTADMDGIPAALLDSFLPPSHSHLTPLILLVSNHTCPLHSLYLCTSLYTPS